MAEREPKTDEESIATSDTLDENLGRGGSPTVPRPASVAPIVVGAQLGGRYRITRLLGQGGMGAVYLALDEVLGKEVALKFVVSAVATASLDKLRDEVLLAQKVTHPNICRTYDLEEVDGFFLVKMEYITGETLSDRLRREARLSVDDALAIARGIAEGLAAAHAQGVVHRDLKPQNVMLEGEMGAPLGRVVLMDFGIASAVTKASTEEHHTVGTPEYMAPEQARASDVDGRADLYALGCVLYHMLVGSVPFPASTPMATALRHIMDPVPDPRAVAPELPVWVGRVIQRLLEKEPGKRYADAGEVLRVLEGPQRRVSNRVIGVAALGLVGALIGGAWLYGWSSLTVEDCAAAVLRRGVLECRFPLDESRQAARALSYRFYRQRGRTLEVERVQGQGHHAPDELGLSAWQYVYDERGHVKETIARDGNNRERLRWVHAGERNVASRIDRRDPHNNPLPEEGTDVTVYLVDLDAHGLVRRRRFANVYGSPRSDRRGAFGYELTTDEHGLVVALVTLGPDGQPAPTVDGTARLTVTRDAQGNAVEERTLDAGGKLLASRDGAAVVRRRWSGRGNLLEESYLGADEKPAFVSGGYASVQFVHDDHGQRVQASYFGATGAPVLIGDGYATWRATYDDHGDVATERFFGVFGEATLTAGGYAERRITRTAKGKSTEIVERYHDIKGALVRTNLGYAQVTRVVDEKDQLVEQRYHGPDDHPTLTRDGFAARKVGWSERGLAVEERYLGVDGKPTLHRLGYAALTLRHDERGRLVEERFLDVAGQPARHRDGHAATRMRYDELGNRVEIDYLDGAGKMVVTREGMAGVRAAFDRRGDLVEETLLGEDGAPRVGPSDWARRRLKRDAGGNIVEEALLDAAGDPIKPWPTYPVLTNAGVPHLRVALTRSRYDGRGRLVERAAFNHRGEPLPNNSGWSTWRAKLDDQGHVVEERFFSFDAPHAGTQGCPLVRRELDGQGRPVVESCAEADGKPRLDVEHVWTRRWKRDPWGRPIEVTRLGLDGNPIAARDGSAIVRTRYDERGRAAQTDRFDGAGHPVEANYPITGVATVVRRHDAWGRLVEERYFGADKKPRPAAGLSFTYDMDDREVRHVFFDTAGEAGAGVGSTATGAIFAWQTRPSGSLDVKWNDGRPVRDPGVLARALAHRRSYAAERLRPPPGAPPLSDPFRGARGLLLVDVVDGSEASRLDLRPGDVLIEYDGRPLERPGDLVASLANATAPAPLILLRDGKARSLTVHSPRLELALEPQ